MRILIGLCLMLSQLAWAGADYGREKKWAEEVVPGVVVGDAVYLRLEGGHQFLGLYTEVKDAKAALIVVHGLGIHPDWGMVGTLRSQLAEQGYTTLSIQMPVLNNEAKAEAYAALMPEASDRIGKAVDYLNTKGYQKVAIVSHSMGSAMSHRFVTRHQDRLFAWASLGLGQNLSYSSVKIPVLDLHGQNDLQPVMNMSAKRKAALAKIPKSRQVVVKGSDHFFNGHEPEMVEAVRKFISESM